MKPYDQNVVTYESMLIGYTDAVARFETGVKGRNPVTAFVAVFESLNWAVALDERIGEHWVPCGESLGREWRDRLSRGAEIMDGVRFVRCRVHHQWSDGCRGWVAGGVRRLGVAVRNGPPELSPRCQRRSRLSRAHGGQAGQALP
jgi:hypothetical protein